MRGDFMTLFLFTTRHLSPYCADSIANSVIENIAEIEISFVAFAVLRTMSRTDSVLLISNQNSSIIEQTSVISP
jgi:hypothetical protein